MLRQTLKQARAGLQAARPPGGQQQWKGSGKKKEGWQGSALFDQVARRLERGPCGQPESDPPSARGLAESGPRHMRLSRRLVCQVRGGGAWGKGVSTNVPSEEEPVCRWIYGV